MKEEKTTPLRQRMIEDMRIRGLCAKTQQAHIRHVKHFASFLGRSPDTATPDDLRAYQLDMTNAGVSATTFNVRIISLRFFFGMTCGRQEMKRYMQFHRQPRKLPVVLSVEEVAKLLDAVPGALVVDLLTGTLESVTDLTLFGGANALAVESAPRVWEIVQAGAAELLAPGRYRLTRLLRGQRGTEGAMANPAPAGARVVVLDDSRVALPIAEADLGLPWNWRIGPASRPVGDETYVATSFTPEGAGLRPFSLAHVEQPWRKPRTPGDLTIRWVRRSRSLSADNWGAVEAPLAEET